MECCGFGKWTTTSNNINYSSCIRMRQGEVKQVFIENERGGGARTNCSAPSHSLNHSTVEALTTSSDNLIKCGATRLLKTCWRRRLLATLGGALSIMTISSQTLTMAAHTREKISTFRCLVKIITGTLQSRTILYASNTLRDANDPRSNESNGHEQLFALSSTNFPFGYKVGQKFYWVCRCVVQGSITNKEIYHPQC